MLIIIWIILYLVAGIPPIIPINEWLITLVFALALTFYPYVNRAA